MSAIKDVIEYSKMNYMEVLELPCDLFLLMRKKFIIDRLNETEDGRQYLEDCERYSKTNMDRKKLKEIFGGENKC